MTPAQIAVLDFVTQYIDQRGYSPTFVEIGQNFGYSTRRAWNVVQTLIEQGMLLQRGNRRRRSISLPGGIDLRSVPVSALRAELGRRGETLDALRVPERHDWSGNSVTCACDFCDVVVPYGHLMCRKHWFAVPWDMREALKAANSAGDAEVYQDLFWQAKEIALTKTAIAA